VPCRLAFFSSCADRSRGYIELRAAAHLLTQDEAQRIAINIAKLPGLLRIPPGTSDVLLQRAANIDGSNPRRSACRSICWCPAPRSRKPDASKHGAHGDWQSHRTDLRFRAH
jgi:hypothetical protein